MSPVAAKMISYACPVASSCPTCGMQHAQSDLQSTWMAIQPLPHSDHHASPSGSLQTLSKRRLVWGDLPFLCSFALVASRL
jgi:hypothetical protein